jgi:hypothetical protein
MEFVGRLGKGIEKRQTGPKSPRFQKGSCEKTGCRGVEQGLASVFGATLRSACSSSFLYAGGISNPLLAPV